MNLAGIAQKAQRGYGITAAHLGYSLWQFRPSGVAAPVSGAPLAVLTGYFDPSKALTYEAAAAWAKPMVGAVLDASTLLVGDYLVVQADPALPGLIADTYFVTRCDPARPPLAVLCNAVLDVLASDTPAEEASVGYQPPSDPAAATDMVLASGWPVSLLIKTRGDAPAAKLPTDGRAGYFEILMPAIPGVAISAGLRLRDAAGLHYHVATAERSQYGTRMLASIDQA